MSGTVEVAIVDKNPVVRAGLETVLLRDGRFKITGSYALGADFLAAISASPPAVAIAGWAMMDVSGSDILAAARRAGLKTRVVIYTGEPGHDVLRRAIRGGAWGFVSKSEEPDVLIEAVMAVARGRLSLPYVDLDALNHDPLAGLTARERELLAALANGWTNLQIASRTGISRNTVKYHLKNLFDKLGVTNRAMAVALYLSSGRVRD